MEKLNFKFTSNDTIINDEEVNYFIKDNKYNFMINDEIYILDENEIILTKKDKEKELVMDFINNVITINIKDTELSFKYPIKVLKKERDKYKIEIEYLIEEDNIKNQIIITY